MLAARCLRAWARCFQHWRTRRLSSSYLPFLLSSPPRSSPTSLRSSLPGSCVVPRTDRRRCAGLRRRASSGAGGVIANLPCRFAVSVEGECGGVLLLPHAEFGACFSRECLGRLFSAGRHTRTQQCARMDSIGTRPAPGCSPRSMGLSRCYLCRGKPLRLWRASSCRRLAEEPTAFGVAGAARNTRGARSARQALGTGHAPSAEHRDAQSMPSHGGG
jgi:hypothetical protein